MSQGARTKQLDTLSVSATFTTVFYKPIASQNYWRDPLPKPHHKL